MLSWNLHSDRIVKKTRFIGYNRRAALEGPERFYDPFELEKYIYKLILEIPNHYSSSNIKRYVIDMNQISEEERRWFFHLCQFSFCAWLALHNGEVSRVTNCHLRCTRLCFVDLKSAEFCIVVSLVAQAFPQDRWPCDHAQVVPVESLLLPHLLESPYLEHDFVIDS